jgi:hypothetical protein
LKGLSLEGISSEGIIHAVNDEYKNNVTWEEIHEDKYNMQSAYYT